MFIFISNLLKTSSYKKYSRTKWQDLREKKGPYFLFLSEEKTNCQPYMPNQKGKAGRKTSFRPMNTSGDNWIFSTYRRCLCKYRRYLYIFSLKIKKHRRCVKKTKAGKEVSTVVFLPFPAFVFGFHAVISRYPR